MYILFSILSLQSPVHLHVISVLSSYVKGSVATLIHHIGQPSSRLTAVTTALTFIECLLCIRPYLVKHSMHIIYIIPTTTLWIGTAIIPTVYKGGVMTKDLLSVAPK